MGGEALVDSECDRASQLLGVCGMLAKRSNGGDFGADVLTNVNGEPML